MKQFMFAASLVVSAPAMAEVALTIPLPVGGEVTASAARYSCDGGEAFTVQYINAGANRLALLPVDGEDRIFVNVISGSGARYASGEYIWWSRGASATLENELSEGSLIECAATGQ